jgi:ABC-type lipoprotein export system ATPase subunit
MESPFFMLLTTKNITKSFKLKADTSIDVLRGLNFDVEIGESVALMGPSGAGKSTLLYILGALDKPDYGSINYFADSGITDIFECGKFG